MPYDDKLKDERNLDAKDAFDPAIARGAPLQAGAVGHTSTDDVNQREFIGAQMPEEGAWSGPSPPIQGQGTDDALRRDSG